MALEGYASATSVAQGNKIDFHLSNTPRVRDTRIHLVISREAPAGPFAFKDSFRAGGYRTRPDAYAKGCGWKRAYRLKVPSEWPSGYYRATFVNASGESTSLPLVVRARTPGRDARVLFCVPVTTFQAYNWWSGKSLYTNESPERARKVSFDRPSGPGYGQDQEAHSLKFVQWMARAGIAAEFCTSIDLHTEPKLLDNYQLLISAGHDEYWSKEMRDHVEAFIRAGGNVAFFSGNTCWWQVRLEDNHRTLVCYRDAIEDPLTGTDNSRVTVQWHAAPVNRPENSMTGVSYRHGAGHWIDFQSLTDAYQCNFPEHWVFEGTGLEFGSKFGVGCVGYETDAAEMEPIGRVMRATCRDGTPSTFVVLAWAELSHWRAKGQGGHVTMGIHRSGGVVFTAGTVQWADKLDGTSPQIDQITRNVVARLSKPYPADAWERIGNATDVISMAACEERLFAVTSQGALYWRDPIGQNVDWVPLGDASQVVAICAPIEAASDRPVGLYAATRDGTLCWRAPEANAEWVTIGRVPNAIAMAASNYSLFVATRENRLWQRATSGEDLPWQDLGDAGHIIAMAGHNSKLFGISHQQMYWREPVLEERTWTRIGPAEDFIAIACTAGKIFAAKSDGSLWWRDALA